MLLDRRLFEEADLFNLVGLDAIIANDLIVCNINSRWYFM